MLSLLTLTVRIDSLSQNKQYIIFIQLSSVAYSTFSSSYKAPTRYPKYSTPSVLRRSRHYVIAKVIVEKASLIDGLHKRPDSQVVKWVQQGATAASSTEASAQISMEALWC